MWKLKQFDFTPFLVNCIVGVYKYLNFEFYYELFLTQTLLECLKKAQTTEIF